MATGQIRAVGTIGGNLCQRPWCWYFRHPQFVCLKRGGRQCSPSPAATAPTSACWGCQRLRDVAPVGPGAALMRPRRARRRSRDRTASRGRPIEQFFKGRAAWTETVLGRGRSSGLDRRADAGAGLAEPVFLKHRVRNSWDFALSEVAVSVTPPGLGAWAGCASRSAAWRRFPTERPRPRSGAAPGASRRAEASARRPTPRCARARPLAMNGYKIDLTRALVGRALAGAARA